MMKPYSLRALTLGAALAMPISALKAAPVNAPVASAPACAPDSDVDVIEMFARLPEYTFRYFGNYNHISTNLLDGKGVIVDKAKNYIEIPYEGNSNHPDRDKVYAWQMTAFRDKNNRPVVVVNSSVLSQSKVKPFIHVFRFNKSGYPYRTTAQDFPFKVEFETMQGRRIPYTYWLPRTGNTITSALPESDGDGTGHSYRWTGSKFVKFMPKYVEPGD